MKLARRFAVLALCVAMVAMTMTACGGSGNSTSSSNTQATSAAASTGTQAVASSQKTSAPAAKIPIVALIKSADWKWIDKYTQKMQEHFPEYDFVFKDMNSSNVEQVLKTMIAAGNPPDVAFYWPNYISSLVSGNMALDLTPYLTENNNEWTNNFVDGTLEMGKIDGKVYAVPFESVYPMMFVNKDLTAKAGVTVPDGSWTWDQFTEVCKTIQDKLGSSGVYPFALRSDLSNWLVRGGALDNWDTKQQSDDFAAGKISFLDPHIVQACEASKAIYDKNYVYPGKGALVVKAEEVLAAFKANKIAIVADVNVLASADIKSTGITNIQVASMPHMGNVDILLGGCGGFFIPANVTHKDDAVKVLKYMTGAECMQIAADAGDVVTIKGVTSPDPNIAEYAKDTAKVTKNEVVNLSPQINDGIQKMPADYIYKGKASLENLEKLRLQALEAAKK